MATRYLTAEEYAQFKVEANATLQGIKLQVRRINNAVSINSRVKVTTENPYGNWTEDEAKRILDFLNTSAVGVAFTSGRSFELVCYTTYQGIMKVV